jgi:hypothetical protein
VAAGEVLEGFWAEDGTPSRLVRAADLELAGLVVSLLVVAVVIVAVSIWRGAPARHEGQ